MKKLLILFVLILATSFAFADTIPAADTLSVSPTLTALNDEPAQSANPLDLLTLVIPSIIGIVVVLLSDTAKHLKDGSWNFVTFFRTKIKPAGLSILTILITYFVSTINDDLTLLILGAVSYNLNIIGIAYAGTITAIIDGVLKTKSLPLNK